MSRSRAPSGSVSDQRLGEEARAHLAAIVQNSHDAIVSKTLDGIVTSWNRAAEKLFGYAADEIVGRPVTTLIPPERVAEEAEILARLRRGERIDSYETQRRRQDGAIVDVSLTISPVLDSAGRVIGASKIARDISARKAEERRRLEIEEALRAAARRKDEFLATMAHELRNPLAPLVNSLDVLQVTADPHAVGEVLGIVRRQVGTLVRLVDDLMDASRIARGLIELKWQPLQLAEVVGAALEIAQPLVAARAQQLRVTLPDAPVRVRGDATRLTQVIGNLLNNAAKYTPQGGCIEIELRAAGGQAVLRVADNGHGIPAELLGQIFEMFAQVDRSIERTQGGLGIGLSIVKRLVELHGGTVEARSEGLGRGSEFTVCLPLVAGVADAASPVWPVPVPAAHRVLIADDNVDAAQSLSILLKTLGQDVHIVHSGQDAVDRAAWLRPDVILMDIGMPGVNGYEAARLIRGEPWGQTPLIVAITGWGQEEDRRRSKEAGFDQHMVKPVTLDALCRVLVQAPAG